MFIVHGSKTALEIAEWSGAFRFYECWVGVGYGSILNYVQDFWKLFIVTKVWTLSGWFHLNLSLFVCCCYVLSGHLTIPGVGVPGCRVVFARE
jgi:hypothetical protein